MQHIMLDLETMGTKPSAAIVAIGAVFMDFENDKLGDTFYQRICLESSARNGGVIDAQTVKWWLKQDDKARKEIHTATTQLNSALLDFREFVGVNIPSDSTRVWGDGAAFDNVILRSAYDNAYIKAPWSYWNDRCYRTVKKIYNQEREQQIGTAHNALDDAISQANNLLAIVKKYNLQGDL
ncbi:MAG: 3'-5' exoribonuclease [Magnetococcus sp. YQC-3]